MDVDEIDDDDFIIKEKMDSSYNLRERKVTSLRGYVNQITILRRK